MVSFVCDACGQTVKKQKVEKHYQSECRNCSVLSCIDCGKDFPGDSYASHTSCISEAEKYQGKLYKAKDKLNKGERKQQEWLEQVRTASSETEKQDPRIRKLLAKITSYNNVPRKETKFKKFCENSINVRDTDLLEKLWQVFSQVKNPNSSTNANHINQDSTRTDTVDKERLEAGCHAGNNLLNNKQTASVKSSEDKDLTNKSNDINKKGNLLAKEKKRKKRKFEAEKEAQENGIHLKTDKDCETKKKKHKGNDISEQSPSIDCLRLQEMNGDQNESVETKEKFKWGLIIKRVLKSAPDEEMPVKKLRKKVLNEFQAQGGDPKPRTEQELRVLFEKKLHKNSKVKVVKERAKLCK